MVVAYYCAGNILTQDINRERILMMITITLIQDDNGREHINRREYSIMITITII